MLLFITFRYQDNFAAWKQKKLTEIEMYAQTLAKMEENNRNANRSQSGTMSKSAHMGEFSILSDTRSANTNVAHRREML